MTTYCNYDTYGDDYGIPDRDEIWNSTCAHDTAWFQKNSQTNPRSHHRLVGAPEWWFKNQISIIWDPISETYIYHNKNTGLTFDDPDEALFEEQLPVLEIDETPLDTRLSQYPHITAIYNVGTDSYWYHNSETGTKHFTFNRALGAWHLPTYPKLSTPTHTPGLGMMHDPEYDEYHEYHQFDLHTLPNTTWCGKHTRFHHQEVGEFEGEEEEHKGDTTTTTTTTFSPPLSPLKDDHLDIVEVMEQYYGREAQKRDWANMDYNDFINGNY